ncbi:GTP cyclohydrolase II [Cupriavidus oxalaticus]|jgi:GTP cyclohydrolase II|uniref:GTP cyclohydrolase-2 n=2 Tax=Cupriavidus oxalaticus TaxID=96344 RepID=A0A976BJH0_9BURK|nr:GTP cyclohydrolase II [Cupriavidus oxalaticus]
MSPVPGRPAPIEKNSGMNDTEIELIDSARLPTRFGDFTAHAFKGAHSGIEHLALSVGEVTGDDVLIRMHSECLTGDVFGSCRCDCGPQLELAMEKIAAEGRGILLYLRGHEGRGIGLAEKIRAYRLQDGGLDTVDANLALGQAIDARNYAFAADLLHQWGVTSVRLMSNNPLKAAALEKAGIRVNEQLRHIVPSNAENEKYLATKRTRMGHLLD